MSATTVESIEETNTLTGTIIGAAIEVHRALGPGLLESAYEPIPNLKNFYFRPFWHLLNRLFRPCAFTLSSKADFKSAQKSSKINCFLNSG